MTFGALAKFTSAFSWRDIEMTALEQMKRSAAESNRAMWKANGYRTPQRDYKPQPSPVTTARRTRALRMAEKGFTMKRIAEELDCPLGTVKSDLMYARAQGL